MPAAQQSGNFKLEKEEAPITFAVKEIIQPQKRVQRAFVGFVFRF